jgi:hypothetical protein
MTGVEGRTFTTICAEPAKEKASRITDKTAIRFMILFMVFFLWYSN